MCRTRVEAVTRGGGEGLSAPKGKEIQRFFWRYTVFHGCVHVCCVRGRARTLLGRSRTNAQYAAACAHRRIGRPRGDATALRRYNYLRALL